MSVEEWHAAGGGADHDVFFSGSLFGRMNGDDGNIAKLGHLSGEGATTGIVSSVHFDPFNPSHAAHRFELCLGLEPGAKATDDFRVRSSHKLSGNTRRGSRSHLAEQVGFDQCDGLTSLGVKQSELESRPFRSGHVRLVAHVTERFGTGRQHMQRRTMSAGNTATRLMFGPFIAPLTKGIFHGLDRPMDVEQPGHIFFSEIERGHGKDLHRKG